MKLTALSSQAPSKLSLGKAVRGPTGKVVRPPKLGPQVAIGKDRRRPCVPNPTPNASCDTVRLPPA